MSEKVFLNLLFLCGILSQGIIETFADENIKESTGILDRQKRVISRIAGEDKKMVIQNFPYIVQIKHNMRISCTGTILSNHVVITIAKCVLYAASEYHVGSGSARSDRGTMHNVTGIRRNFDNYVRSPWHCIALLTVYPPFVNTPTTRAIELHSAPLLPGILGIIPGWGFNSRANVRGTDVPKNLRSIKVPIMAHRDCVNIYQPHNIRISEKDICTFHPQKQCGHTDAGAPLVVDGYLVGVHLLTGPWMGSGQIDPEYPAVFALLQHPDYKQWITTNIHSIETQFSIQN